MRLMVAAMAALSAMLAISVWKQSRQVEETAGRLVKEQAAAAALEKRVAELLAERDMLRAAQGLAPAPVLPGIRPAPAALPKKGAGNEAATGVDVAAQLAEKDERIAAAVKARDDMEAEIRELRAKLEAVTEETERLSHAERQLRSQVESAERRAAAAEKDGGDTAQRVEKLETANRELRRQAEDAARQNAAIAKITDQMQDLNRRQEAYLQNLLRRYREVTDLYRTIALRNEVPRDEISRIQNAISLAEEDLRQLQALNAQAGRVQKNLSSIRR
jgi:chromosome segregation ATPase